VEVRLGDCSPHLSHRAWPLPLSLGNFPGLLLLLLFLHGKCDRSQEGKAPPTPNTCVCIPTQCPRMHTQIGTYTLCTLTHPAYTHLAHIHRHTLTHHAQVCTHSTHTRQSTHCAHLPATHTLHTYTYAHAHRCSLTRHAQMCTLCCHDCHSFLKCPL
jgi:hypothetical protein